MNLPVQTGWTFAAAAVELGVTRGRVWQLVKEGKLATIDVHGRQYVSQFSLETYRERISRERERKAS